MIHKNSMIYKNSINELKKLLDEKKESLTCILNIVNKSEKNNFYFLKKTLSKDDIIYKIEHVLEKIDRTTKDLENEKNEKKKEQLKSEMMEYIDMFENAI